MQIMIYDEFIQMKIRTFPIMDYVYNFQTINFIECWLNRNGIATLDLFVNCECNIFLAYYKKSDRVHKVSPLKVTVYQD